MHREALRDGRALDPEIRHAPPRRRPPWVGGQALQDSRRERPRARQGLVQPPSIQGADERRQHEIRDRAVVPLPGVQGQHEVGALLEHGARQALEPFTADRRDVGLEHDERARAEAPRDADRQPERGAAAGHAVEGHRGELRGGRLVMRAHERQTAVGEPLRGGVRRARVGVDQDRRHAGEVLLEPGADGVHDHGHRRGVVVGRHRHGEVRLRQALELAVDVGGERRAVRERAHRVRWITSARSSTSSRVIKKERRTCSRPAAPMRGISSGLFSRWRMRKAAPSTE